MSLGRRAPERADHRHDRHRQDLRRLCPRAAGWRKGCRAIYRRASKLFPELALARADGTYTRLLARLARADVLLLDDWAMNAITGVERRDLLEILDHRYASRATIVISQAPPKKCHAHINEPTHADAICDRLLHNSHRLVLKGPSRRNPNEEKSDH